ncbi:MAG: repressor LexA [Patescibacteria group bacterium]|nr:repressor LexA [Patescibacteria group bacterium]
MKPVYSPKQNPQANINPVSGQKQSAAKVASNRKTPTKAEHQVLTFISQFIAQHGYGPSYREIMRGCGYSTLSAVSLHVGALVHLGYLEKKERGARSLSLTDKARAPKAVVETEKLKSASPKTYEKWLVEKIETKFKQVEDELDMVAMDNLYVLTGALKILGYDAAALSFKTRLSEIVEKMRKL